MGFTKKVSQIHQDPTSQLTRLKGSGTRHHRTSLEVLHSIGLNGPQLFLWQKEDQHNIRHLA